MARHKTTIDRARGRRFRETRDRAGLLQQTAATRAGLTISTLSRWENGKSGEFSSVGKLAAVYAKAIGSPVDPGWLLTGREAAAPGAEYDPPYPAWLAFLETSEALAAPPYAINELRAVRWDLHEPSVTNYQVMLAGYLLGSSSH